MAKKDNKSHHDRGVKHHYNRGENENSFVQRQDPRLNQQEIAYQNLARNDDQEDAVFRQMQQDLVKTSDEIFDELEDRIQDNE